jgi:GT2 family glycosyltransferase
MVADSVSVVAVIIAGSSPENAASLVRELSRLLPSNSVVVAMQSTPAEVTLSHDDSFAQGHTHSGTVADVAREAFEQSEADFLLLLHDDVSVGVQSLSALLSHMGCCHTCAIAVPRVSNISGAEEASIRATPTVRSELLEQLSLPRQWREFLDLRLQRSSLKGGVPPSTAVVVRRVAWERDGGLDSRLNVGYGIFDLALRYRPLGWEVHLVLTRQPT